jgi:hypothetical protein
MPHVTDQNTFFLKENDLETFMHSILACTKPCEFRNANQIKNNPDSLNLALKTTIWQTW